MKVKELIEILQKADPELPVCTFQEGGAEEVDRPDVNVYESQYIQANEKMGVFRCTGPFVGIGVPGNFDATMYEDNCRLVKTLYLFRD